MWWSLDVYHKKDRIYMLGLQASQPPLWRHSLRWAHRSEEMRASGRLSSKKPASSTGSQCRTGWVWKWTKYNKIGYPLHVLISPTRRFDFQTEKLGASIQKEWAHQCTLSWVWVMIFECIWLYMPYWEETLPSSAKPKWQDHQAEVIRFILMYIILSCWLWSCQTAKFN